MLAAPEFGTIVGVVALEHPDAAAISAKMIVVRTIDNRRDISGLPSIINSGSKKTAVALFVLCCVFEPSSSLSTDQYWDFRSRLKTYLEGREAMWERRGGVSGVRGAAGPRGSSGRGGRMRPGRCEVAIGSIGIGIRT